jgi:DNA-binding NtrC family response regulator
VPLAELEKQAILAALHQLRGDKLMTAKLLGIGKTTLYRKLKEYGIVDRWGVAANGDEPKRSA